MSKISQFMHKSSILLKHYCMVIYENIKVIEITIEVYGNMKVIKWIYYSIIPCKSHTVP